MLLRYPPLAFLLNAVLGCLNFLRDCPILTARDDVLAVLAAFLGDVAAFVAQQRTAIRSAGKKYFGDGFMRDFAAQRGKG